jgi:hypothetical protein
MGFPAGTSGDHPHAGRWVGGRGGGDGQVDAGAVARS